MDSQFNSLVNSYHTNYVQYKVTGNQSYKNSYISAQEGLDSILAGLQQQVDIEKDKISAFYKSGVEQKINKLQATNRKLQRGILTEKDDIVAAKIRGEQPAPSPSPPPISTSQYVILGVLGATMLGLAVL
jgi:hypothetical protein